MAKKVLEKPAPIESTLDLSLVAFDGDRDMRAALMRDRDFARVFRAYQALPDGPSARRNLLLTAVRLSPAIAPSLFACVRECTGTLGITTPVEIYCSQNAQLNAFVMPPEAGRICIGFSSTALERFSDDELRFVLGHELGHALFEHHAVHPGILEIGQSDLSSMHAMRLFAWKRYAELTADRVGLLCCRNFETAVRTFFKLTSGLTDPRWYSNVVEAAMHHAVVEAANIETAENQGEWLSTHPYSPLRIKALDVFYRSRTYHKLLGEEGGELSEEELEREVSAIVELMNPSVLSTKSTCGRETRVFLAVAGMTVALADKRVKRSELDAVAHLVGPGRLLETLDELREMPEEERWGMLSQLAGVLNLKLSVTRRLKVLEDLTAVALADRKVQDEERAALYGIAELLGFEPSVIEGAIAQLERAVD